MSMVENIRVWTDNPQKDRVSNIVRIEFKRPVTWTVFTLDELMLILECWIIGEEMRYPQSEGYRGRWMLHDRIEEVFKNT